MELAQPDRARLVRLNRTALRLWEWGERGAPVVICLHGAFDHGRMWDELAPALASDGFHVVAPDLRGHGDSGRLSSGHAWSASALDIAMLADELGAPVGLIGHSFGGGQALFVAGVWPELVRWVVNLDGLGPPGDGFDEEPDMAASVSDALSSIERLATSPPRTYPDLESMVERRRRINVRLPEPWLAHLTEHGAGPIEDRWAWKVDPMFSIGFPGDFSVETLLAQYSLVECPVLVLTGTEADTWSDLADAEVAERVAALRARHQPIVGAGHYVHIEAPGAVLGAIRDFLGGSVP